MLMPVTTPVVAFIVATAPSLLLHTPPVVAELSALVLPPHNVRLPVIDAGLAVTVAIVVERQPNGRL